MNLDPQPGDRWTRPGYDPIEVVRVHEESGDVYLTQDKTPKRFPRDEYLRLARNTVEQGGTLWRDGDKWNKGIENELIGEFEV